MCPFILEKDALTSSPLIKKNVILKTIFINYTIKLWCYYLITTLEKLHGLPNQPLTNSTQSFFPTQMNQVIHLITWQFEIWKNLIMWWFKLKHCIKIWPCHIVNVEVLKIYQLIALYTTFICHSKKNCLV